VFPIKSLISRDVTAVLIHTLLWDDFYCHRVIMQYWPFLWQKRILCCPLKLILQYLWFMEILWRWIRASRLLVLDMRSGDETTFFHFFHFFRTGVTFNMKIPVEGKLQFTACFANYLIALSLVSYEPFSPFITPHVMYKDVYFLIHHESFIITQHTS